MGIFSTISKIKKDMKAKAKSRDEETIRVRKAELKKLQEDKVRLEKKEKLRKDLNETKNAIRKAKYGRLLEMGEKFSNATKEIKKRQKKRAYSPYGKDDKNPWRNP